MFLQPVFGAHLFVKIKVICDMSSIDSFCIKLNFYKDDTFLGQKYKEITKMDT